MGNPLAGIGMDSNRSQFMARQRIESQINLPRLFAAIDADFSVIILRKFKPIRCIKPKRIILREAQNFIAPTAAPLPRSKTSWAQALGSAGVPTPETSIPSRLDCARK